MGRKKSSLSKISASAKRKRQQRQKETEEERIIRLLKTREQTSRRRQKETPEQRAIRLSKSRQSSRARQARLKEYRRKVQGESASTPRKPRGNPVKQRTRNTQNPKSFRRKNGDNFTVLPAVAVKLEPGDFAPTAAVEKLESVQEIIEVNEEIKQEYDGDHAIVKIELANLLND